MELAFSGLIVVYHSLVSRNPKCGPGACRGMGAAGVGLSLSPFPQRKGI